MDYLHAKLKPEQYIKNGSTIGTDSQLVGLQQSKLNSPQAQQNLSISTLDASQVSLAEDEIDVQAFGTYSKQLNDNLYQKLRKNTKQDQIQ